MRIRVLVTSVLAIVLLTAPVEAITAERRYATSSFVPPEHCIEDSELARELRVVQACVQRFSPTHEFMIILSEYRLNTSREDVVSNAEIAAMAVEDHMVKLFEANEGQQGITLQGLKVAEYPRPKKHGADYCKLVLSLTIDERVPGYEGEEFQIWVQTFVCARADSSDNSIQIVELRSSERFRKNTDEYKERFESAIMAEQSLKMY